MIVFAAAQRPDRVGVAVSRGGCVDRAGDRVRWAACPRLLVVGETDEVVLDLNRRALTRLATDSNLEMVRGATHLFEGPGALDVGDLAARRFVTHVVRLTGSYV